MKHVTFAEKSLLMGDDAADCLLEYARVLAETTGADTVTVTAIGTDGNTVDAAFLLNSSSVMVIESTNSATEPPDNSEAVRYMQDRIDRLLHPREVQPSSDRDGYDYDIADFDG